jgi:hypothetical protein
VAVNYWLAFAIVVNALFLIELLLNSIAFGPIWILIEKKVLILECILQIIAIYAEYLCFDGNYDTFLVGVKLICVVFLLRMLRLLYLLSEIRQFDLILATLFKF